LRGSHAIDAAGPWTEDAPAVARLRRQGAVLLGKTTTPEFGWKGVTDSERFGITRNPWDVSRTPGGSSGGAAAAAALGMGTLHIGTDGGGSIRIPAAFTGIFGLKPSFGRVAAAPLSPFGTVAHLGPMTRTVTDAALMLSAMAGDDPRDWHAWPGEAPDYRIGLDEGVRGLRIGFAPTLAEAAVDPAVAEAVRAAVGRLGALGAVVEEVDPPLPDSKDVFAKHWFAGAMMLLRGLAPEARARVEPGLKRIAEIAEGWTLAEHLEAVAARARIGAAMKRFHTRFDLLATPSLPITAFAAGRLVPDGGIYAGWPDWSPFCWPFNLTQQPACSIPCGSDPAGLPIGLQLVGPMHGDALVLRAARAFESACPWPLTEAPRGSL
jgi:aspartyl-tRNA(Asn)/glutamyl-tRNA(Gln) amidotransferase subunit A